MYCSQYMENAVFRDQSMATAELFENEESRLFEQSSEGSFVDILVHTRLATKSHDPVWESFASSANTRGYVKTDSDIRNDFYSSRIKDPEQMAQVAAVSRLRLVDRYPYANGLLKASRNLFRAW